MYIYDDGDVGYGQGEVLRGDHILGLCRKFREIRVLKRTCHGHFPGTDLVPSTTLAVTRVDLEIPHLACDGACMENGTRKYQSLMSGIFYTSKLSSELVKKIILPSY